ncbi:NTP transferase domain-containing protein [Patescibacteria group bacterium]|nr:NTP transferase domain-containing protein [Patescibacteria group bacterium]
MQALILAAGEGKRIKPIVTSKPLIPFGGQTLLDRVIHNLKAVGINKFLVVVSPKDQDKLKAYPTVIQPQPNGMSGAVLAARSVLVGPTVVVNGDDLIDPKILTKFSQAIKTYQDKVVVTAIKSRPDLTGGYFDLRGPTLQVVEKPKEKQPSEWLKLVLDYFPRIEEFIAALKSTQSLRDDVYEQALNQLGNLSLVKAAGYFQPLKYPWQILDLAQLILTHYLKPQTHPSAQIHKTAVIEGLVQIEAGVRIMPYAIIKGPVYLGKQVIIGDHALVRNSLIEANSVVGYKSEIVRSYVGPNNNFHANYVGDSVIEADCNLGSGATLANLRFDKKEIIPGRNKLGAIMAQASQLGVNVSVMPGVSLGAKAIVGSGLVLAKSLEAGEFKKN